MQISERWEYLKIDDIPDSQFESVRDSYAELGYQEVESGGGSLTVRKSFPVTGQILID